MQGLLALAVAMGIGRFAFTPILPMMQADAGLSVAQGGWLASANYVGYLAGALLGMAVAMRPSVAIRGALVGVGVVTLAMALTTSFTAWMLLRFAAGVASALVLVYVSAWGFPKVGVVFAGVGTGIAAAGLACLALMVAQSRSAIAWVMLGGAALIVAATVWPFFARPAGSAAPAAAPFGWTPEAMRLVACYGVFGFGYIIPATFLPAMARDAIGDPVLFGWFWPLFGAAAAASTLVAARLRARFSDRTIWIAGQLVMAAGVFALMPGVPAMLGMTVSALFVGGTFMVVTMVGLQEARRIAGPGARKLIAAMTAAFATGQIAGPLLVSALAAHADPMTPSLLVAGVLLVFATLLLWRSP